MLKLKSRMKPRRLAIVLCFAIFVFEIVVNKYQLQVLNVTPQYFTLKLQGAVEAATKSTKKAWIPGINLGYLDHVADAFKKFNYTVGDDFSDWDVLWSYEYPFNKYYSQLASLQPHQKVNHIPGSGIFTNKVSLATSNNFIPKAFRLPVEGAAFNEYVRQNPDRMWVLKGNDHRGVKVANITDLDLTKAGSFIQEYISDTFLIDGRKFDIGIYVTITSIDPLLVYSYEGDWLIRFCRDIYYPFDPTVVDKYVVGDDYLPVWEIPSLSGLYREMAFSRKNALFAYLSNQGHDPRRVQGQLQSAIREVLMEKKHHLILAAQDYASSRNFFELVRFDFVLDKNLNVYLMEVNMSPNLSSKHFPANKQLYEQIIDSLFALVGLSSSYSSTTNSIVTSWEILT